MTNAVLNPVTNMLYVIILLAHTTVAVILDLMAMEPIVPVRNLFEPLLKITSGFQEQRFSKPLIIYEF